jgi:hypothetical protein
MKACCIGFNVPSGLARPSMLVISRSSTIVANVRHDSTTIIDEYGAGAALSVIATLFGSRQTGMFAQCIEQGGATVEGQATFPPIYPQFQVQGRYGVSQGTGRGGGLSACAVEQSDTHR